MMFLRMIDYPIIYAKEGNIFITLAIIAVVGNIYKVKNVVEDGWNKREWVSVGRGERRGRERESDRA